MTAENPLVGYDLFLAFDSFMIKGILYQHGKRLPLADVKSRKSGT